MKIRSITYFINPKYPLDESALRKAGEFLASAKLAYEAAGYEVQTMRMATIPFPLLLGGKVDQTPLFAQRLSVLLSQIGVSYAALGPALIEFPESYPVIPDAIAASENVFFGGVMADRKNGISLEAVQACAKIIEQAATITPDGFANLRFAALANVKPGAPFFPAAYHEGDKPAFAIAVESADLAVEAFDGCQSLEDGRRALISEIEKHGQAIARTAASLMSDPKALTFNGIDFSLAPFPDDAHSLGGAVEKMGVSKIGLHGSLAAAAILTEAVDRADFPHTGFSGFMQPILEDSILARRAAEGVLTVKDALLYSAVCGTGLDTVPLAGNLTAGEMAPLLLDISALAMRLNKPLTARLMPVPGKKAGDVTEFDFGFFANSRVMALDSAPLGMPLGGSESFFINKKCL
jgi:uncharacterized protein (UPF0210 family)